MPPEISHFADIHSTCLLCLMVAQWCDITQSKTPIDGIWSLTRFPLEVKLLAFVISFASHCDDRQSCGFILRLFIILGISVWMSISQWPFQFPTLRLNEELQPTAAWRWLCTTGGCFKSAIVLLGAVLLQNIYYLSFNPTYEKNIWISELELATICKCKSFKSKFHSSAWFPSFGVFRKSAFTNLICYTGISTSRNIYIWPTNSVNLAVNMQISHVMSTLHYVT